MIVDVDEGTPPSGWVGPYYRAITEYLCLEILGITYEEIRVSTREPNPDPAYIRSDAGLGCRYSSNARLPWRCFTRDVSFLRCE